MWAIYQESCGKWLLLTSGHSFIDEFVKKHPLLPLWWTCKVLLPWALIHKTMVYTRYVTWWRRLITRAITHWTLFYIWAAVRKHSPAACNGRKNICPEVTPYTALQEIPSLLCLLLFSLVELVFLHRHNSIGFLPDVLLQCETLGAQVHLIWKDNTGSYLVHTAVQ